MKGLFKTFIRSLRSSITRFLAIFFISFLGVGFFAGINTVEPVMIDSAQTYFDANNLSDITIISPLPLNEEDIMALRTSPNVADLDPSRFADVYMQSGDLNLPVRFFELPPPRSNALDRLQLVEGRLPENSREILMDASVSTLGGQDVGIGANIKVYEPQAEDTGHDLSFSSYEIVGTAHSPLYLTYERDATILGSGSIAANVFAMPGAFLGEKTNYLKFRMRDLEGLDFNSAEFEERSEDCQEGLQEWGEEVYAAKTEELRDRFEAQRALFEDEKEKGNIALAEADEKIAAGRQELIDAQEELDQGIEEGKAELEAAAAEIEQAKKDLAEGEAQLLAGELELARGEAQYMSAGIEIALGRSELSQAWQTLEMSRQALNGIADLIDENETKRAQMLADREWLEQVLAGLPAPVDQNYLNQLAVVIDIYSTAGAAQLRLLDPTSVTTPYTVMTIIQSTVGMMDALAVQWESAAQELIPIYSTALAEYEQGKAQYEAGLAQYQVGAAEYSAGGQALAEGRTKLRESSREVTDGKLAIRDGEDEIAAGWEELEEKQAEGQALIDAGWVELENAEGVLATERLNAEDMIQDAEELLSGVERQIRELPGTWFVYRNMDIPGFAGYAADAERIGAVGKIFPLFFFLVAALVSLTTMTRMVEDERQHMGLLRSLGYGRFATATKYLAYALLATILGSVVGGYTGLWAFPTIITWAYRILYTIPTFHLHFQNEYLTASVLLQISITLSVTVIALVRVLKEKPATLTLPKAPRPGKRILLERIKPLWRVLGFSQKLTVRNIFRYKVRSAMTVIGIAGCTALLVAGLGIGDSITDIVNIQTKKIWNYDMLMTYAMGQETDQAKRDVEGIIDESSLEMERVSLNTKPTRVRLPGGKLVPASWMSFEDSTTPYEKPFIRLENRLTDEPQSLEDEGVVVTEKLAENADVGVGDTLEWMDVDGRVYVDKVIGISENYVEHYLYMSESAYEHVTLHDFESNVWLLRAAENDMPQAEKDAILEDLSRQFAENDEVVLVTLMHEMVDTIDNMLEPIGLVVVVIVATAALLAFVVLYNLVSISIGEREREIATIKVLGFFNREVSNYIFSEVFVLTTIASFIGLVLGYVLHIYIILTVEMDNTMFGRNIHWDSFVIAFVLTQIFTLLVAITMHFSLQKIDMIDSLKSLE